MPFGEFVRLADETAVHSALVAFRAEMGRFTKLVRREGIPVALAKGVRYLRWKVRAESIRFAMLRLKRPEDRFTLIYRTNMWAARESVSGPASSLRNTENLRRELPLLLSQLGVKTFFDAPCGDFRWMPLVLENCPVTYIGGDIVAPLIEANRARHGSSTCRFVRIDVTCEDVPRADLWMCRGLLSLLSFDDGFKVLRQFVRSGTPYLLLSSHLNPQKLANVDIKTGDFRPIDLLSAPFNLPPPLQRLADGDDEDIYLWSREQIAQAIGPADSPCSDDRS